MRLELPLWWSCVPKVPEKSCESIGQRFGQGQDPVLFPRASGFVEPLVRIADLNEAAGAADTAWAWSSQRRWLR